MGDSGARPGSSRRWVIAAVAVVCLLFFTQCFHLACMTGVACIPVVDSPSWYQGLTSNRRVEAEAHEYHEGLNALQKAIRQKEPAAVVDRAIRAAPDQAFAMTARDESTLDLAVQKEDPRTIALLLAAGVDGFTPRHPEKGDSPFSQALEKDLARLSDAHLSSGRSELESLSNAAPDRPAPVDPSLLIDPFLAVRKLDPKSTEAADVIARATESTLVFDRLRAYGIPSDATPDLLQRMIENQNIVLLRRVLDPDSGLDAAVRQWSAEDQDRVLREALNLCRFDIANGLVDRGIATGDPGLWVATAVNKCIGSRWRGAPGLKTPELVAALIQSLGRAVRNGAALNSASSLDACPLWLGGAEARGLCRIPDDVAVVRALIALGADPYLYLGDRQDAPLLLAWRDCDGLAPDGVLWTMLGATPGSDRRALSQLFAALFENRSEAYCQQTGQARLAVAAALLEKGAKADDLDRYGHSALSHVLGRNPISLPDAQWLIEHGASLDKVPADLLAAQDSPDPKAREVIATLRAMPRPNP